MVVSLIPAPETLQNFQCLRPGGLLHGDGLKAALQRGILFDILAVLVDGGGPDHLQLPPAEGGLEDVGGVDGPLGAARPHDGVELVDEQDDVPRPADLLEDVLQFLLKLPPVLGARHHGGQVQGVEPLARQVLGGGAVGNGGGQTLYHRRLAHPGLADEGGVVLGAAGENLHKAVRAGLRRPCGSSPGRTDPTGGCRRRGGTPAPGSGAWGCPRLPERPRPSGTAPPSPPRSGTADGGRRCRPSAEGPGEDARN